MQYRDLNKKQFTDKVEVQKGLIEKKRVFDPGKLSCIILKTSKRTKHHYHKISEEHQLVLKGKGKLIVEGKEYTLKPNISFSVFPGEKHHIEAEEELHILVINIPRFSKKDEIIVPDN